MIHSDRSTPVANVDQRNDTRANAGRATGPGRR
jgi:hypothetical protein